MHLPLRRREIERSVTSRLCWTILLAVVIAPPAVAQTAFRTNATILDDGTPVQLYPDSSRTPLTMLASGTPIRAGEGAGDWVNVVFEDPRFGRRAGYVLKYHVQMDNAPRAPRPARVLPEKAPFAADRLFTLAGNRYGLSTADAMRAFPERITSGLVSGTWPTVKTPPSRRRAPSPRNAPQRAKKRTVRQKT